MVFECYPVMAKERCGSGYFPAAAGRMGLCRHPCHGCGDEATIAAISIRAWCFSLGVTTLLLISGLFSGRAHNIIAGFAGISFQPSEVAKVAVILFLAYFLENRINSMRLAEYLLPAVLPTLMFLVLIVLQPDLGTAIACAAITAAICLAGLGCYLGYRARCP